MSVESIPFWKMNGCGNDFIVIDNRDNKLGGFDLPEFVRRVCRRRISLGADGVLLLESSRVAHFRMRYFNADGSEGEMCGNGARCLCRFACVVGAAPEHMWFETLAGIHEAWVQGSQVQLGLPDVPMSHIAFEQEYSVNGEVRRVHSALVGVPHAVVFVADATKLPPDALRAEAKAISGWRDLFPEGANVNFVSVRDRHSLTVRTYERGVEDETLACGTGSTAAAIVATLLGEVEPPVLVHTRGGLLRVSFDLSVDAVRHIRLEGSTRLVAIGHIVPEAWEAPEPGACSLS